jgi:hypothetical protein
MFRLVAIALLFLINLSPAVEKAVTMDPDPGGLQRIEQLWVITFSNDAGAETIVQARDSSGATIPLIAADREHLNMITGVAIAIVREQHVKLRLVKFSERSDVGETLP